MKKILYPAAAACLLLMGCSENELVEEATPEVNPGVEVLVAGFEANNPTRVAVDAEGKLTWTAGDAFFAFSGSRKDENTNNLFRAAYNLTSEPGKAFGTFKYESGKTFNDPAYAFYPNIKDAQINAVTKKLTVTLPNKYASGAASLNMPMFCKVTDWNALKFKHLMGLLDFNFGNNLPEGYQTMIIKSDIDKNGQPSAWVEDFELADVDADTYQFTPTATNRMVTINGVTEGHFGLPVPDGVHINHLYLMAQNAAAEEYPLLTLVNMDVKVRNVYFIN